MKRSVPVSCLAGFAAVAVLAAGPAFAHTVAGSVTSPVDAGAHYAVAVDSFAQQGPKLTGSDETGAGLFGNSVAISADGNTALIGGFVDNSNVGAAWVFTRSGGTWTQQGAKLTGSDEVGTGFFGWSVALSADGNTALIGGEDDTSGAGAAWVFTRTGSTWIQQGPKLTPSDGMGSPVAGPGWGGAGFGSGVALSADGNTALIGGFADNCYMGAAWVFTRSGSTWTQQGAKLTASGETAMGDRGATFGAHVALSADGKTALIGGPNLSGGAWVFTRSGATWTQQSPKLTSSEGGNFGSGVGLSADGNTALIGAEQGDAAWVFTRAGSTWTQQGPKLTASDGSRGADGLGSVFFGSGVALSPDGNTALIGGKEDHDAMGAAWLFTRSGSTWTQQGSKLTASDAAGDVSGLGFSVALSADARTAIIGGPWDANYQGAAWVFTSATAPGAPTGVSTSPGDGQASVSFTRPPRTARRSPRTR